MTDGKSDEQTTAMPIALPLLKYSRLKKLKKHWGRQILN